MQNMWRGFVLLLVMVAAACQVQSGRPAPEAAATAPANAAVEQVLVQEPTRRVVRLANGLTVIVQQNKTAPVVACRIYVKAGSITEGQWMGCGISHVLEHLVAGASSVNRKQEESSALLRAIGNDSNAFTSFDNTCYFITTTREKWPIALDLLSDWVTHASFTDAEFAREYEVVQRELEMGEVEPPRIFGKLTYANRYLVHPARHPVIGYKPAFQKLTAADAREYYRRMYVPDNMIVSIAGDVELDAALKLVQEKFAGVARKAVPAIAIPAEPPVLAPRVAVARADVRQARLQMAFPTVSVYSPELYALDVLAGALAGGESSLLVRELRDERALVTSVSAANDTPPWGEGTLTIDMELTAGNIPAARRALGAILQEVAEKGLDLKELQKAKARVAAELVYNNQTPEQQATRNAEDFLATGDVDFSRIYAGRVRKVTAEEVRAAARKYLRPETLLTSALLPLEAPDTLSTATTQKIETITRLPVTKTVLPNGLTVLTCKNTAAPIVSMQLYVLGGLLAENQENNGIGQAMVELMNRGTDSRTGGDIAEYLDSSGGSITTSAGRNTFSVSAVCLKEHFQRTYEVFLDVVDKPAFTKEELERIRPLLLANIERHNEDWFDESLSFLCEQFYENSPYRRRPAGAADVVRKLTPEQVRKHYEQYFRSPRNMVLAIYGDFDALPKVEESPLARFKPVDVKFHPVTVLAKAHEATQATEKTTAAIALGYGPGMVSGDPDRYAVTVLQTLLGGYNSPDGSLLFETLRGKGLVYTVQASNIPGVRRPDGAARGMFLISALGKPGDAEEIVKLIRGIVDDVRAGKFTEKDVAAARDQAVTGHELQNQTITAQAQDQAIDELLGLGYNDNDRFPGEIRKVTRADVLRVAEKYLTNPVVTITRPKKK